MSFNETFRPKADRFIRSQVGTYGLNGSNTLKNPPAGFPSASGSQDQFFSIGNSFAFGYNGETFGFRESSTCMYWTEVLAPRRDLLSLREELKRAAQETFTFEASIGVVYTGSSVSRLVLRELVQARRGKITVLLPVCADGSFDLKVQLDADLSAFSGLHAEVHEIRWDWNEFQFFLDEASGRSRCVDAVIAFSLFISEKCFPVDRSSCLFIHEAPWPRIVNQNFDVVERKSVGPAHWCLEDRESDTEAARHMIVSGRRGFVSFCRSTPEIFWALMNDVSNAIERDRSLWDSEAIPETFFEEITGIGPAPPSWAKLSLRLRSFEPELNRRSPKAREEWLTPLDRKNEGVYGQT